MHDDNAPRPRLAVATVMYNSADLLGTFLDCCARQDADFKLWAVDNASHDRSVELAGAESRFPVELCALPDNRGVAAGYNTGIRAALEQGYDYVLLLNNDVEFGSDLFSGMLRSATDNKCVMLSPQITYQSAPASIWYTGADFSRWKGYSVNSYLKNQPTTEAVGLRSWFEFAPACCLLVHRSVFTEIGLLDEDYFVYSEDQDFCWRTHRAGLSVFVDRSLLLLHAVGGITGGVKSEFTAENSTLGRYLFIRKHCRFHERVLFTAGLIAWIALRRLTGKDSAQLAKARWRGLRSARRVPLSN